MRPFIPSLVRIWKICYSSQRLRRELKGWGLEIKLGIPFMVFGSLFVQCFFPRSKAGYCVQLESHKGMKRVTRVPVLQKHIYLAIIE